MSSISAETASRRSACPIACTLDLVGDRWTLLVLRDLFGGKGRFEEFCASPEGIATNVLADRLERLERGGFATRAQDPDGGRRVVYSLSDRGRSLLPVLRAFREWGLAHLAGTSTLEFEKMRAKARSGGARRKTRRGGRS